MRDQSSKLELFVQAFFRETFRFRRAASPPNPTDPGPWEEGIDPEDLIRVAWFLRDDLGLPVSLEEAQEKDLGTPEKVLNYLADKDIPAPACPWPPPVHLGRFILEGAEMGENRPFIIDQEKTLTWGQARRQALGAAKMLEEQGFQRGDKVVLHLTNSNHYATWFFATLLAGGTVIPLHQALRNSEVQSALENCQARFLVDENPATAAAMTDKATILWVGKAPCQDGWVQSHAPGESDDIPPVEPSEPAMILCTSGTTGEPKGVCLTHRALYENTISILSYLSLTPDDRVISALPWCFAYGNSVFLTHARVGGTLVLERNIQFPAAVRKTLETHGVTGIPGVPPFFATLLSRGGLKSENLPRLRYITVAGGALPVAQLQKLRELLPGVVPWVMYGQTESCARITYVPARELDDHIGSAGRPVTGMELQIKDPEGNFVTPGEKGEVVARGTSLMTGYYRDPEETARALQDGWLHTGDLGYLSGDGFLYIVDRIKAMLKIEGFRLSPLEVERTISRIPWVEEVLVHAETGPEEKSTLVARVVPRPRTSPDEQELREFCAGELAAFKVPRRVYFVEKLPRTVGGKLKRTDLG